MKLSKLKKLKKLKKREATKKRGVVATPRFEKTNYLKTNLLKQIKKIFSYANIGQLIILRLQR